MRHSQKSSPQDRPLSNRERLSVAMILTVAVLAVTLLTCGSCTGVTPISATVPAGRTARDQHNATVQFHKVCSVHVPAITAAETTGDANVDELINKFLGTVEDHEFAGTGVIVSADRALTNVHVATCTHGELSKLELRTGADRPWIQVTVEVLLPALDVARVKLESPVPEYFTPVQIGEAPELGETVCAANAWPRWSYKCGIVQPSPKGYFWVDMFAEFGNSGSGVYYRGKLVGLLFAAQPCQDGVPCVAWVSPIADYAWLIP
jgi:hypothetical protein